MHTSQVHRLQFHPALRQENRKAFHLTHFSPIKPIPLHEKEVLMDIPRDVTGSLKFGERLKFSELLDSRFEHMKKHGKGKFNLSQPIALTKLYLQGDGIQVELDTSEVLSARATSVFDKDVGSNPFIHLKTTIGGRFDSTIPGFSTAYWNRHYIALYELDITVTFTASEEYGMGSIMAMGVSRFAGMKRISDSGVNIPQQMSDYFFKVKPCAFDLEVHVSCADE